nr:MAG TPA: hypothetical protein [Caudoviricetes sp.]
MTRVQGYESSNQRIHETYIGRTHRPRRTPCPSVEYGQHLHPHRPGWEY